MERIKENDKGRKMSKKCGIDIVKLDPNDIDSEIKTMFESLRDSETKSYDSNDKQCTAPI